MIGHRVSLLAPLVLLAACGGAGGPDARYPSLQAGCPVKKFPAAPTIPVDDLGLVTVDCPANGADCDRAVMDAVCAKGGDVAWGWADNALSATRIAVHAAHSRTAREQERGTGCEVRVYDRAPTGATENIGVVTSYCAADDSRDVCLRELEDQVCRLGGDMLWQVEGPAVDGDKQRFRGRAAHSK
jgi:hypothetical protein